MLKGKTDEAFREAMYAFAAFFNELATLLQLVKPEIVRAIKEKRDENTYRSRAQ